MNRLKKIEEPKPKKKARKKSKVARSFMDVLNGNVLTKEYVIQNLPYIFFLTAIMLLYIGMGYNADKTLRDINALEDENLDLRTEEIALKTEFNVLSGQAQIADSTERLGLRESRDEVPHIIEVSKKSFKKIY